jgi:SAM-dependent methyltransferase
MFGYVPRGMARGLLHRAFGAPNFLRRLQWPTVSHFLDLDQDHVVLDVGCGDLHLTAELAKRKVKAVIATDASPRLERLGYVARQLPRLRIVRTDATALPLANNSVDRVLASSVLQMVREPAALLAECRRVLSRTGILVLTVPESYRYLPRLFGNGDRYTAFLGRLSRMFGVEGMGYISESELKALLRAAGFRPVAKTRVPGPLGTFIWEASLATTYRFNDSRLAMLLAFASYPFARMAGAARSRAGAAGCELVMSATVA